LNLPDAPASPQPPASGPAIAALVAAAVSTALLAAVLVGLPTTLRTVLLLMAPGFAISATAVAISMGWIFLLVGRQHREPRWLRWAIALQSVSVLEMLGLILLILHAQSAN
jgi:cytochrome bd-type quinol oxidase subunit 1